MSLQILKWSLRELKNQKRWSIFFILNISIGLTGFIGLDAFKSSLQKNFRDNAKSNLSGDISFSARRMFSDKEIDKFTNVVSQYSKGSQIGRTWELFSMAVTESSSRLVQLKAIDSSYPLYGELQIEVQGKRQIADPHKLIQQKIIWVYPEILTQINAKVGDEISFGGEKFKIDAVVIGDQTQGFRLSSIAAKVFVGIEQLKNTRLIGPGTTMQDELLVRLAHETDLKTVSDKLLATFNEPGIRVTDFIKNSEDSGGALKYLSDYLGLVSLVALFLAALGSIFLFRHFIYSRYYSIAIQNALGMPLKTAGRIYILQLAVLGFIAAILSLIGAQLLLPTLSEVLSEFTPLTLSQAVSFKTSILAIAMGVGGSLLIGIPFLIPVFRVKAQQLLQEGSEVSSEAKFTDLLLLLPAWMAFWYLAIIQANSPKIGSLFFVIFSGSLITLWMLGWLILSLLPQNLKWGSSWYLRQAILSIKRRKGARLAVIVAIGLGSVLINLLPQLQVGLKENLESPETSKVPSLFLFDIQTDQLQQLKASLKDKGFELSNVSPLVRARILKVNDTEFERAKTDEIRSREEEQEARFRNRGVNLSYREHLTEAERIVKGKEFPTTFDSSKERIPEISLEERFADTMKISLGDKLTFDVQGVEILGQVTSLRKVKWNSFQPNFFIQFQAGVLEDAPQTYLASIAKVPKSQVDSLQTSIGKAYSNISVIDVRRLIDKIIELTQQMSWSLELMAYLSILAGVIILYSLVSFEVNLRSWDLNMMKIFGSQSGDLFKYLVFEFGLIAFLGAVLGGLISLVVSYLMAFYIFDGNYKFDLGYPVLIAFLLSVISCLVIYLVSRKIVKKRPSEIIQEGKS